MEGIDIGKTKAIIPTDETGRKNAFFNHVVVQDPEVKRRCISKFNALPQKSRLEIVRIINDGEECHQNLEKVMALSGTNDQMTLCYFKNKAIFIEMLAHFTTDFDPANLSYMERPISFQDKDPRMMQAIRNLAYCMTRDEVARISVRLGMSAESVSPLVFFSNCIFGHNSRSRKGKKTVTLNLLLEIFNKCQMEKEVNAIDEALGEYGKRIKTHNKLLTNILSMPLEELEEIKDLHISKKVSAIVDWALKYKYDAFFIYLFHMVCQPESRGILDGMLENAGSQENAAYSIVAELRKQKKPFVVFYEAVECSGFFSDEMQVKLEQWADENKNLFLQQSQFDSSISG